MATTSTTPAVPLDFSPTPHFSRPTFLMCPPQFYDVDYVINPWMAGNLHRPSRDVAFTQWNSLYEHLKTIADVRLLHARADSPDMVFVAHAALVHHGIAAISSFAYAQRQPEEQYLRDWFKEAGFLLWDTPRETSFEGEGDVLFDPEGKRLWAAHGVRTCLHSHRHVADAWHTEVVSLHLMDPRFYHLDTCFAPLAGGYLLYYPGAFDVESLRKIEEAYPVEKRIAVTEQEATHFACNVINIGQNILMHTASNSELPDRLMDLGFDVTQLVLTEFLKGGGSAKSLALRLSDMNVTNGL
ncbi:dimethylarginine dimethylaminohydrolase family protein [Granulicella arctica]|uniref:N-dimethylarginine dimethylaminohydrolase n=1 Tax=Granulicella arctica TaxID=940613 RepID=A0A7Y9PIF7_9BACT|nr:arginine deiminase-related protein [Granulicella arctica]NYF80417.1 N-dimethylarginine dimethylaminohydrolase [Granulicella arctica]